MRTVKVRLKKILDLTPLVSPDYIISMQHTTFQVNLHILGYSSLTYCFFFKSFKGIGLFLLLDMQNNNVSWHLSRGICCLIERVWLNDPIKTTWSGLETTYYGLGENIFLSCNSYH